LVHVSTDYVFDGKAEGYHEESKPNPLGFYGKSKLAGENALIGSDAEFAITRTMVLYGYGKGLRLNFATWLAEKLRAGEPVNIVDDQLGHPTLADDLALAIKKIADLKKIGIFHAAGKEFGSRLDFAVKLAEVFGFDKSLISPAKTADLNQPAPRPLNSRFIMDKLKREIDYELGDMTEGIKKLKQQLESADSN